MSSTFTVLPDSGSAIQFEDVRIGFDEGDIFRGVSFRVQPRETMILLGETGTGKTLTLKLAAGLLPPSGGVVRVLGQEISSMEEKDLLDFRRGNLNYTPALSQPQAAVGCLLNSPNRSESFAIRRDDPSEAVPIKESQSQFPTNPRMTPPTVNCSHVSNRRLIGVEDSLDVFTSQEDDCAPLISEPCAAHPIRKGCPRSQCCEF